MFDSIYAGSDINEFLLVQSSMLVLFGSSRTQQSPSTIYLPSLRTGMDGQLTL